MPAIGVGNREAQHPDVKKPDGSQNHSQIVPRAAKYGIQGITEAALEPIPTQLAFVLHVTNRRLNGTSSMNGFPDGWGDTALLATAPDRHAIDADAPITLSTNTALGFCAVRMLTCSMASGSV